MEGFGCRWRLSLHGEHFCGLTLGRHGWTWYRKSGIRGGFIKRAESCVPAQDVVWVLCPAENHCPRPTLLLLSLPAVAGAPGLLHSVRKQHEAVGTSLPPRDWAWIRKLLMGVRVAPCSNPCLWSRKPCRSQLLLTGTGTGCSYKQLLMLLCFVGRTAAWRWPPVQCRHGQTKGSENHI